jgi:aspartyl aminopeptidase
MTAAQASAEDLCRFVDASPSPFHCVKTAADRLAAAGFVEHQRTDPPAPIAAGSGGFLREAGTLLAWRAGADAPAAAGFRMLLAHTDSPNLRLKPQAEFSREGYGLWAIDKYGGVTLATWADRDLGLAGRVGVRTQGGVEVKLVDVRRPVARISNLAIHLNRGVNDSGLLLNPETQMPPIFGMSPGEGPERLRGLIAAELGCAPGDLLDWELGLYDVQPPVIGGLDGDFIYSARMDNQFSCYAAIQGLIDAAPGRSTAVVALFDHEEIGSNSARGARSALLRNVLRQLTRDHEEQAPGGLERALAHSFMVSADMAHGVHPNFADKHEARHKPMMNAGVVIKHNASVRYATDARSASHFRALCQDIEVPLQDFVNRTDLACGSTVGPSTAAQLGVTTVDVGCAMLSMHSAREVAGAADVALFTRALQRALEV